MTRFSRALSREGYLYVVDAHHSVTKLKTTGLFLARVFPNYRSVFKNFPPGLVVCPASLTVDMSSSLVYVSKPVNNHVSIFDANGNYLNCFWTSGKIAEGGAIGITVDTIGNLCL